LRVVFERLADGKIRATTRTWDDAKVISPNQVFADARNFYKVEKWTRDGTKVDSLLYAGNSLG
jgi:hypothetical protein